MIPPKVVLWNFSVIYICIYISPVCLILVSLFPSYSSILKHHKSIMCSQGWSIRLRKWSGSLMWKIYLSFPLCVRSQVKSCSALFQLFDIPFFHMVQSVRLTKFDYRLANKLDPDMQKLRCRTNYKVPQICQRFCQFYGWMNQFHWSMIWISFSPNGLLVFCVHTDTTASCLPNPCDSCSGTAIYKTHPGHGPGVSGQNEGQEWKVHCIAPQVWLCTRHFLSFLLLFCDPLGDNMGLF